MAAKFFINEENMGNDFGMAIAIANKWVDPDQDDADKVERIVTERMIVRLRDLGWDVSYGDSMMTRATEYERQIFDSAWEIYLNSRPWMVIRADKFGPGAVPAEHRSE